MLQFMYTNAIENQECNILDILKLARKYQVKHLTKHCYYKLAVSLEPEDVPEKLALAKALEDEELEEIVLIFCYDSKAAMEALFKIADWQAKVGGPATVDWLMEQAAEFGIIRAEE